MERIQRPEFNLHLSREPSEATFINRLSSCRPEFEAIPSAGVLREADRARTPESK